MATAEYYLTMTLSERSPAEYYTGGIEPDGVWYNPKSCLEIEDGGKVEAKEFKNLFEGFTKEGEALTRNAGAKNRSTGLDITFSADKSISALWAISGEEKRLSIEEMQQRAVNKALDYMQKNASFCRRGYNGMNTELCSFLAATFRHSTSRDMDPQLHTHASIFNIGFRQDGTTGSLDQPAFYRLYRTAGAIYRNDMARSLRIELGLNMERHGKDLAFTRIKDFPEDLTILWSKRRQTILKRTNELGVDPSSNGELTSLIAVSTRPDKQQDNTLDQLLDRFKGEASELGHSHDTVMEMISHDPEISRQLLENEIRKIPETLMEHDAVFNEGKLDNSFYNTLGGQLSVDEEKEMFEWLKSERSLVHVGFSKKNERLYTTPEMIFSEINVKDLTGHLRNNLSHRISIKAVDERITKLKEDGVLLSVEQLEAFKYVTNKSGAIAVMEGAAGAGKSTVLSLISGLLKDNNFEVIGASTTWKVSNDLGNDCEIDSFAIDSLLYSIKEGHRELNSKSIVIIDEVGTLSTEKGVQLLTAVRDAGAKIILSGDREQQQAVEAGSFLRLAQSMEGGVRIDRIRRQRATVEDILIYKDKTNALDRKNARYYENMMSASDKEKLLDTYAETVERRGDVWQRDASKDLKEGRAEEALNAYHERGNVRFAWNEGAVIWKLSNDWMKWTADNPNKTSIIQARTNKEVISLSTAIRKLLREQGRITGDDYSITVSGSQKGQTHTLELARGDHFIFGTRNRNLGVVNGTKGVVTDIKQGLTGLEITAKVGDKSVTFKPEDMIGRDKTVCLKGGYATTIYSSQGITVDASFNLVSHLLSRESAYSFGTRHRDEAFFYVGRELAEEVVRQDRNEEIQEKPVSDKEIIEALGKRWAVSAQKELVHDHMDDHSIEWFVNLHSLLGKGEDISELLSNDIVAREWARLEEIKAQTFTGTDLEARILVGEFGVARAEAAILGQSIRDEIGEEGVFYEHKDYGTYQQHRFVADALAARIGSNLESHRPALVNYPNVKDEQLFEATKRHEARELVRSWQSAKDNSKVATADKLADQIVQITKSEKELSVDTKGENSKKYMAAAVRELSAARDDISGDGISRNNISWDGIYRGAEDHRERILREGISASDCRDRDLVLDYRRSTITVGRVYSEMRSLAGEGVQLSEQPGYAKLQSALADRDRLAYQARNVSADIKGSFAIGQDKIERQGAIGEARKLVNAYQLQDAKGSTLQRDELAAEIILRTKAEKGMALELDAVDPGTSHKHEKITSRIAMEKGMDWKRLFAQASQYNERKYFDALTVQEQSVHRQVDRYRALEREVGQHYNEAIKESKDLSIARDKTDGWKVMLSVGAQRDRLARNLVSGGQDFGPALKHYRGNSERLQARADRVEAADLVDKYAGFKLEGKGLDAGQVAGEILARVSNEKLDQLPKITAREIFSKEIEWKVLYDDRNAFSTAIDKAIAEFSNSYPREKSGLDYYHKESSRLFDINKRIEADAIDHESIVFDHVSYAKWHEKRVYLHDFGERITALREDFSPLLTYHYRDTFNQINTDIEEYVHIDRRHEEELEYVINRRAEEELEMDYERTSVDNDQGLDIDDDDNDNGYSW